MTPHRLQLAPGSDLPEAHAASVRRHETYVAVLLAAATVATTLIAARTADLAGAAGGSWEQAVRVQIRQSALRTENELYVYGDPVTVVTQYQAARLRAAAYAQALARDGLTQRERASLSVVAAAEQQLAAALRDAAAGETPWLRGSDETYDLDGRLADEQRRSSGALAGAEEVRAAGDESSRRAVVEALAAVPAALAFLLASAAQARRRSARIFLLAGAAMLFLSVGGALALEVVPFR
jgi:hypothetical protein